MKNLSMNIALELNLSLKLTNFTIISNLFVLCIVY